MCFPCWLRFLLYLFLALPLLNTRYDLHPDYLVGDIELTHVTISDRRADGPPILVQRTTHVHPQCQQRPLAARVSKGRYLVRHQRQLLSISDGDVRRAVYRWYYDDMQPAKYCG